MSHDVGGNALLPTFTAEVALGQLFDGKFKASWGFLIQLHAPLVADPKAAELATRDCKPI